MATQAALTRLLWVTRTGWRLPGQESGTWTEDPWQELADLVPGLMGSERLAVMLSPEWFVYLNATPEEGLPAELVADRLGLVPGRWRYLTRIEEKRLHLVAYPRELEAELEKLAATYPQQLDWCFVPLSLPGLAGEAACLPLDSGFLHIEADGGDTLRQWHWLPGQSEPELRRVDLDQISEWFANGPRLDHGGEAVASYRLLHALHRRLLGLVAVLALLSLGLGWYWRGVRATRAEAIDRAEAYLATHRLAADRLPELQQRGEIAWEQLKAIQEFSNRRAPVANHLAILAQLTGADVAWKSFHHEDQGFTLVLTADRTKGMNAILDCIDRFRSNPNLTRLHFEELRGRSGNKNLEVKLEGSFR